MDTPTTHPIADRVRAHLTTVGEATSAQVAQALGLSEGEVRAAMDQLFRTGRVSWQPTWHASEISAGEQALGLD